MLTIDRDSRWDVQTVHECKLSSRIERIAWFPDSVFEEDTLDLRLCVAGTDKHLRSIRFTRGSDGSIVHKKIVFSGHEDVLSLFAFAPLHRDRL